MYNDSALTAFDFFAGGGGASFGLHQAGINVLAALNHSPVAIATHATNFPGARHLLCDIRVQKSWGLGHADIMWASPDCTHHSIAKGGQSRDAKERALAEELPRFAYNLNVNCVMVENVKEFLDWGPLEIKRDKHGDPVLDKKGEEQWVAIKARKKEYYNAWLATMHELGFVNYEYRLLNAADFGVPQSRTRYFGIFTRKGVPIRWPEPTHDKHGRNGLPKWTAVRGVLDLDDRGRSIFTEWDQGPGRRPGDQPAEKTLRRILAGLKKHVIGKTEPGYLYKRTGNHPDDTRATGASIDGVSPTIPTCYLPDLVVPAYIHKRQSNPPSGKPGVGASIDRPSDVIAASWQPDLVSLRYLYDPYGWHAPMRQVERESSTIIARQDKAPLGMLSVEMIIKSYGGDPTHQAHSTKKPAGAITCTGGNQHLTTAYLTHNYSGGGQHSSVDTAHPANTCNPHGRIMLPAFVKQYNGGSDNCRVLTLDGPLNVVPTENRYYLTQCLLQANGTRANDSTARLTMPLDGQAPTLNTNGGNLHLMSYYGQGGTHSLCYPCPVVPTHDRFALWGFVTGSGYGQPPYSWLRPAQPLVASRRHPYLLLALPGSPVAVSLDAEGRVTDSPAMAELKQVCRDHGIADIYMRMLKVEELKLIMGFPADYYLGGGVTKQKEMLGNAVVPQVSEAIARAMTPGLLKARLRKLPKLRAAAINRWQQAEVFKELVA
jgi:DNA (cytosine-5)-methyltransferase 1